jgi:hypothetical protein
LRVRGFAFALLLALCAAGPSLAQTCSFNRNQPGSTGFTTLDPTSNATATFTVTVNVRCARGASPTFTISGQNDSGPNGYRLKHLTRQEFISYSVGTTLVQGTKLRLDGQIVPSSYQNAWAGDYSDQLTITVLP